MKNNVRPRWKLMVACVPLVSFGCGGEQERVADEPTPLIVDISIVKPQMFEQRIEVSGNILPFEQVELKAPLSGTVLEINFEEGQGVQKGASLIRIDDRAWQAEAKGLRGQVELAQAEVKRKKSLMEIEGASQQELDAANASLTEFEARLEELEVNINLANVKAPFSGIVGMRDFSLGSFLSEGTTITQLAQIDKLKLDFDLPSKYASYVEPGQQVTLMAGRDSGSATIYAVNPSVKSTSRTLQVRALIKDKETFRPGEFAEVGFSIAADSNAILIPTDAIIPELNAQTVFVLDQGKTSKRKVTVGGRSAQNVQILSGINLGDSVIISGLLLVKDGMKVDYKISSDQ